MEKKRILLKDIEKVDPFKVPEGYFDNLTDEVISKLPENTVRKVSIKVNWWYRNRPWIYMAAMITGVILLIRIFAGSPTQTQSKSYASGGLNLTSLSDIDDFYNYYEDGLARIVYDDAFYLTDFTEDTDLN